MCQSLQTLSHTRAGAHRMHFVGPVDDDAADGRRYNRKKAVWPGVAIARKPVYKIRVISRALARPYSTHALALVLPCSSGTLMRMMWPRPRLRAFARLQIAARAHASKPNAAKRTGHEKRMRTTRTERPARARWAPQQPRPRLR